MSTRLPAPASTVSRALARHKRWYHMYCAKVQSYCGIPQRRIAATYVSVSTWIYSTGLVVVKDATGHCPVQRRTRNCAAYAVGTMCNNMQMSSKLFMAGFGGQGLQLNNNRRVVRIHLLMDSCNKTGNHALCKIRSQAPMRSPLKNAAILAAAMLHSQRLEPHLRGRARSANTTFYPACRPLQW